MARKNKAENTAASIQRRMCTTHSRETRRNIKGKATKKAEHNDVNTTKDAYDPLEWNKRSKENITNNAEHNNDAVNATTNECARPAGGKKAQKKRGA